MVRGAEADRKLTVDRERARRTKVEEVELSWDAVSAGPSQHESEEHQRREVEEERRAAENRAKRVEQTGTAARTPTAPSAASRDRMVVQEERFGAPSPFCILSKKAQRSARKASQ